MHQPKKFSELTPWQQLWRSLAILGLSGSAITGALLWAADKKLDEKYATDSDLATVQEQVSEAVDQLKTATTRNTQALEAVAESTDSLTLAVIDIQIREVAAQIEYLEREKRRRGDQWDTHDAERLRDRVRTLADLEAQRAILFQRLLSRAQSE